MRRAAGRQRSAALALALALALAACGGGGGAKPATPTPSATAGAAGKGTPVTQEQALVLAQLLERNWEHGGAQFNGTIPFQGQQVPISGSVDFRSGRGKAAVGAPAADARHYVWTREKVYAQSAPGKASYETQTPNPKGDPVHFAIAFLNLLSAETIDNTANIQDQDARFLRHDTLHGTPVDVYSYGSDAGTTYWVDRKTGLLRQVAADVATGGRIELTLTSHAPVKISLPGTA